ncbi:unnamed protein product [Amoebophrya sp. A25]|nr:unnamed protein product [Amoebophrya sp. A25]|eukprot:GSA25T00010738001.1
MLDLHQKYSPNSSHRPCIKINMTTSTSQHQGDHNASALCTSSYNRNMASQQENASLCTSSNNMSLLPEGVFSAADLLRVRGEPSAARGEPSAATVSSCLALLESQRVEDGMMLCDDGDHDRRPQESAKANYRTEDVVDPAPYLQQEASKRVQILPFSSASQEELVQDAVKNASGRVLSKEQMQNHVHDAHHDRSDAEEQHTEKTLLALRNFCGLRPECSYASARFGRKQVRLYIPMFLRDPERVFGDLCRDLGIGAAPSTSASKTHPASASLTSPGDRYGSDLELRSRAELALAEQQQAELSARIRKKVLQTLRLGLLHNGNASSSPQTTRDERETLYRDVVSLLLGDFGAPLVNHACAKHSDDVRSQVSASPPATSEDPPTLLVTSPVHPYTYSTCDNSNSELVASGSRYANSMLGTGDVVGLGELSDLPQAASTAVVFEQHITQETTEGGDRRPEEDETKLDEMHHHVREVLVKREQIVLHRAPYDREAAEPNRSQDSPEGDVDAGFSALLPAQHRATSVLRPGGERPPPQHSRLLSGSPLEEVCAAERAVQHEGEATTLFLNDYDGNNGKTRSSSCCQEEDRVHNHDTTITNTRGSDHLELTSTPRADVLQALGPTDTSVVLMRNDPTGAHHSSGSTSASQQHERGMRNVLDHEDDSLSRYLKDDHTSEMNEDCFLRSVDDLERRVDAALAGVTQCKQQDVEKELVDCDNLGSSFVHMRTSQEQEGERKEDELGTRVDVGMRREAEIVVEGHSLAPEESGTSSLPVHLPSCSSSLPASCVSSKKLFSDRIFSNAASPASPAQESTHESPQLASPAAPGSGKNGPRNSQMNGSRTTKTVTSTKTTSAMSTSNVSCSSSATSFGLTSKGYGLLFAPRATRRPPADHPANTAERSIGTTTSSPSVPPQLGNAVSVEDLLPAEQNDGRCPSEADAIKGPVEASQAQQATTFLPFPILQTGSVSPVHLLHSVESSLARDARHPRDTTNGGASGSRAAERQPRGQHSSSSSRSGSAEEALFYPVRNVVVPPSSSKSGASGAAGMSMSANASGPIIGGVSNGSSLSVSPTGRGLSGGAFVSPRQSHSHSALLQCDDAMLRPPSLNLCEQSALLNHSAILRGDSSSRQASKDHASKDHQADNPILHNPQSTRLGGDAKLSRSGGTSSQLLGPARLEVPRLVLYSARSYDYEHDDEVDLDSRPLRQEHEQLQDLPAEQQNNTASATRTRAAAQGGRVPSSPSYEDYYSSKERPLFLQNASASSSTHSVERELERKRRDLKKAQRDLFDIIGSASQSKTNSRSASPVDQHFYTGIAPCSPSVEQRQGQHSLQQKSYNVSESSAPFLEPVAKPQHAVNAVSSRINLSDRGRVESDKVVSLQLHDNDHVEVTTSKTASQRVTLQNLQGIMEQGGPRGAVNEMNTTTVDEKHTITSTFASGDRWRAEQSHVNLLDGRRGGSYASTFPFPAGGVGVGPPTGPVASASTDDLHVPALSQHNQASCMSPVEAARNEHVLVEETAPVIGMKPRADSCTSSVYPGRSPEDWKSREEEVRALEIQTGAGQVGQSQALELRQHTPTSYEEEHASDQNGHRTFAKPQTGINKPSSLLSGSLRDSSHSRLKDEDNLTSSRSFTASISQQQSQNEKYRRTKGRGPGLTTATHAKVPKSNSEKLFLGGSSQERGYSAPTASSRRRLDRGRVPNYDAAATKEVLQKSRETLDPGSSTVRRVVPVVPTTLSRRHFARVLPRSRSPRKAGYHTTSRSVSPAPSTKLATSTRAEVEPDVSGGEPRQTQTSDNRIRPAPAALTVSQEVVKMNDHATSSAPHHAGHGDASTQLYASASSSGIASCSVPPPPTGPTPAPPFFVPPNAQPVFASGQTTRRQPASSHQVAVLSNVVGPSTSVLGGSSSSSSSTSAHPDHDPVKENRTSSQTQHVSKVSLVAEVEVRPGHCETFRIAPGQEIVREVATFAHMHGLPDAAARILLRKVAQQAVDLERLLDSQKNVGSLMSSSSSSPTGEVIVYSPRPKASPSLTADIFKSRTNIRNTRPANEKTAKEGDEQASSKPKQAEVDDDGVEVLRSSLSPLPKKRPVRKGGMRRQSTTSGAIRIDTSSIPRGRVRDMTATRTSLDDVPAKGLDRVEDAQTGGAPAVGGASHSIGRRARHHYHLAGGGATTSSSSKTSTTKQAQMRSRRPMGHVERGAMQQARLQRRKSSPQPRYDIGAGPGRRKQADAEREVGRYKKPKDGPFDEEDQAKGSGATRESKFSIFDLEKNGAKKNNMINEGNANGLPVSKSTAAPSGSVSATDVEDNGSSVPHGRGPRPAPGEGHLQPQAQHRIVAEDGTELSAVDRRVMLPPLPLPPMLSAGFSFFSEQQSHGGHVASTGTVPRGQYSKSTAAMHVGASLSFSGTSLGGSTPTPVAIPAQQYLFPKPPAPQNPSNTNSLEINPAAATSASSLLSSVYFHNDNNLTEEREHVVQEGGQHINYNAALHQPSSHCRNAASSCAQHLHDHEGAREHRDSMPPETGFAASAKKSQTGRYLSSGRSGSGTQQHQEERFFFDHDPREQEDIIDHFVALSSPSDSNGGSRGGVDVSGLEDLHSVRSGEEALCELEVDLGRNRGSELILVRRDLASMRATVRALRRKYPDLSHEEADCLLEYLQTVVPHLARGAAALEKPKPAPPPWGSSIDPSSSPKTRAPSPLGHDRDRLFTRDLRSTANAASRARVDVQPAPTLGNSDPLFHPGDYNSAHAPRLQDRSTTRSENYNGTRPTSTGGLSSSSAVYDPTDSAIDETRMKAVNPSLATAVGAGLQSEHFPAKRRQEGEAGPLPFSSPVSPTPDEAECPSVNDASAATDANTLLHSATSATSVPTATTSLVGRLLHGFFSDHGASASTSNGNGYAYGNQEGHPPARRPMAGRMPKQRVDNYDHETRSARGNEGTTDTVFEVEVDLGRGRGMQLIRIRRGETAAAVVERIIQSKSLREDEASCLLEYLEQQIAARL